MADHARKLARAAVKTVLIGTAPDYRTRAGARVVTTRKLPWRPSELPGIGIYTLEEDVDPKSAQTAPRELKRHPTLVIEGVIRDDVDDIDDVLDDFALEIENAMALDETLAGTLSDCWLRRTELEFWVEGDKPVASVKLFYYATYFTELPDTAALTLDDLATVTGTTNVGGGQEAADRAEDVLEDLDT